MSYNLIFLSPSFEQFVIKHHFQFSTLILTSQTMWIIWIHSALSYLCILLTKTIFYHFCSHHISDEQSMQVNSSSVRQVFLNLFLEQGKKIIETASRCIQMHPFVLIYFLLAKFNKTTSSQQYLLFQFKW